jgi:hypothetical protein
MENVCQENESGIARKRLGDEYAKAREGFMWGQTAVAQEAGSIGIMAGLKSEEYGTSKVIMVGGEIRSGSCNRYRKSDQS